MFKYKEDDTVTIHYNQLYGSVNAVYDKVDRLFAIVNRLDEVVNALCKLNHVAVVYKPAKSAHYELVPVEKDVETKQEKYPA